jgi:membrane protease YdiL (CAAX protease family)
MQFLDPAATRVDLWGMWFVFMIGVMMPFSVIRSVRRPTPTPTLERQRISQRLKNVAFLLVLFAIAIAVAERDGISLFPRIAVTARLAGLCAIVLIATLSIAELLLASRSPEERKRLWVRQSIPRTPMERATWILSSTVAGITEETIFRGVFYVLVASLTGNVIAGAVISAFVFAIAHYRQGKKNMLLVGLFALFFQWLVITTGSLVPAMVVHGLYDVIRGLLAGHRFEKLEQAPQFTNVEA